jgi:two-component system sensor histidine kinase MprB
VVDRTRIEVRDRGPGISTQERERVFDRFYRIASARRQPGSGLGLAIVKEIATLHNGTITMSERPGGGNNATFELPDPALPARSHPKAAFSS